MRMVMGEESGVYQWIANNLHQLDPDMLIAQLDRTATTAAGYTMDRVFPSIRCPVLLLQADPTAGGLMTDQEVALALPLLARPQHVCLPGSSHVLRPGSLLNTRRKG